MQKLIKLSDAAHLLKAVGSLGVWGGTFVGTPLGQHTRADFVLSPFCHTVCHKHPKHTRFARSSCICRLPGILHRATNPTQELMGAGSAAVGTARRALAGCSDLERCLARLSASVGTAGSEGAPEGGSTGGFGREAAHVVLYEDQAKRRVKVLVGAMNDLQALQSALEAFGQVSMAPIAPTSQQCFIWMVLKSSGSLD